jgi:hypothetical protein
VRLRSNIDRPEEDRKRWSVAKKSGADPFEDCRPAALV